VNEDFDILIDCVTPTSLADATAGAKKPGVADDAPIQVCMVVVLLTTSGCSTPWLMQVLKLDDLNTSREDDDEGPRELSADNKATLSAIAGLSSNRLLLLCASNLFACVAEVVDALGQATRLPLIRSFNRKQLKPYLNIFRRGEPNGDSLDMLDKRYEYLFVFS
jgi:hypothetical protein